jgi:integrase
MNRQGNHRLRKYVATLLAESRGVAVASQYLRHAGEAVTLKAYIARRKGRLEAVGDEFLLDG